MLLIVASLLVVSGSALGDPEIRDYKQLAECYSTGDAVADAEGEIVAHSHDLLYDLEATADVYAGHKSDHDSDSASGATGAAGDYRASAEAELNVNLPDGREVSADAAVDGDSVSVVGSETIFQSVSRDDPPATDTCGSESASVPTTSTYTKVRLEVGTDCALDVTVNSQGLTVECKATTP